MVSSLYVTVVDLNQMMMVITNIGVRRSKICKMCKEWLTCSITVMLNRRIG